MNSDPDVHVLPLTIVNLIHAGNEGIYKFPVNEVLAFAYKLRPCSIRCKTHVKFGQRLLLKTRHPEIPLVIEGARIYHSVVAFVPENFTFGVTKYSKR